MLSNLLSCSMQVAAEIVLIESDEVANGISTEIAKHGIKDLVIGASNNGMFARYDQELV